MADVADTLAEWSSTTDSNAPSNATTIGTGLAPNLREIQAVVVRGLSHKGSDIASAATTDLGAVEGLMHDITGTTTITSFGTVRAGLLKVLKYEGALTITHNSTSLILLGGSDRATANGDTQILISEGSGNWREVAYFSAANGPSKVLLTEQASTSGTSISFTGIPSWAKKITIMFTGVSTNNNSALLLQIGGSGGLETNGYLSSASDITTAVATSSSTAGFRLANGGDAAAIYHGAITLALEDSAAFTWVSSGLLARSDSAATCVSAGSKSLSTVLDRLVITTVGGADTFDAGAINVLVE